MRDHAEGPLGLPLEAKIQLYIEIIHNEIKLRSEKLYNTIILDNKPGILGEAPKNFNIL